ncbi:hypothetical protein SAMN04489832_7217 [Micromonospora cremea]|uniref:Uncharacterized protein n=1 Tax=Micromonospora cremea TaxID=709881 RepID=A0A1N6BDK6_9ACTN|nr:hypothetical protein SAMN04489832_7217 [Micromonospora cremea]
MDKLATHNRLQAIDRPLTSACDLTSQTDTGSPWRNALRDLQETIDNKRGDLAERVDDLTSAAERVLLSVTSAITTSCPAMSAR